MPQDKADTGRGINPESTDKAPYDYMEEKLKSVKRLSELSAKLLLDSYRERASNNMDTFKLEVTKIPGPNETNPIGYQLEGKNTGVYDMIQVAGSVITALVNMLKTDLESMPEYARPGGQVAQQVILDSLRDRLDLGYKNDTDIISFSAMRLNLKEFMDQQ
jgi:hypothetical protein